MIVITKEKDKITVSGHAGYATRGYDIVCASISALFQTFVASVEELTDDKIECEIEPGNAVTKIWTMSEKTKTLIESFFLGVKMIAESYPDNVKVVDEC